MIQLVLVARASQLKLMFQDSGKLPACMIYLAVCETPSRAGSVVGESCAESIPWCWNFSRKNVMIEPIKSELNHHHQLLASWRLDCAARTADDKHQVVMLILGLPKSEHAQRTCR